MLLGIGIGIIFAPKGEKTITAEASLVEVIKTAKFTALEYTYNSIAEAKEENEVKYYVYYKGTVEIGCDFEKLKVEREDNKIFVWIPKMEIISTKVDDKTMDYIFTKEKYNKEDTFKEAYKICCDDLNTKVKQEKDLFKTARENVEKYVETFIKPWQETMKEEYTVKIKFVDDIE